MIVSRAVSKTAQLNNVYECQKKKNTAASYIVGPARITVFKTRIDGSICKNTMSMRGKQ